jgi:hypothetical protein
MQTGGEIRPAPGIPAGRPLGTRQLLMLSPRFQNEKIDDREFAFPLDPQHPDLAGFED